MENLTLQVWRSRGQGGRRTAGAAGRRWGPYM